jgi:hypothetical protein
MLPMVPWCALGCGGAATGSRRWSLEGDTQRARASSSRSQSHTRIASAGTPCTGWSLSTGVRQGEEKQPPEGAMVFADLLQRA